MRSLRALHICKKVTAITLNRGFRTDSALLARGRGRVPRAIPYEPGLRHRRDFVEDSEAFEEVDNDELEGEIDSMNIEKVYDVNKREERKQRANVNHQITVKKFFSPPPQPLMLTCNERECIRYLHKQDPIQWDVKTLSESFPATPDTIKKIIRAKWKVTPERAKLLDSKAQKNWELLAEGKLEAEPYVLEHMKKFVNRREVLLEQIKNDDFYLPEVKKETVWNKGEFTGILSKYEKKIEKFMKKAEMEKQKMISDRTAEDKICEDDKKKNLDIIHEKIRETASRPQLANKETFMFGEVTNFYSKPTTLDDLEKNILRRANSRKKLSMLDKAIIEDTLVNQKDNLAISSGNLSKSLTIEKVDESSEGKQFTENNEIHDNWSVKQEDKCQIKSQNPSKNSCSRQKEKSFKQPLFIENVANNWSKEKNDRIQEEMESSLDSSIIPDERTHFANESNAGKLLNNIKGVDSGVNNSQTNSDIDFSDPGRVERENIHYDAEVKDIENTSFWNTGRSSKERESMELLKQQHEGPKIDSKDVSFRKTALFNSDPYPERINIPKSKRGSGLTFRIKDCYYDDDGEFLYRVPGMIN